MFDFHYKPDILRNSRASGGLDQSPSARLTSHAQKQPPIAFLFHSSQPHGAPNGNVSFGRTSAHPQGPSCFSTHPPRSAEQNAPPPPPHQTSRFPPTPKHRHPPSQPGPRRRRSTVSGAVAGPGASPVSVGPERPTWPPCRRKRVRIVGQRARDGTTRRGEVRPRPPGPAPAPWLAAPPPRGVPGR